MDKLPCTALAALGALAAVISIAPARAADVIYEQPAAVAPAPGVVVVQPPPRVVVTPPAVVDPTVVEQPVYSAPVATYYGEPVYDGSRYYLDCWWEWDHRICRAKPRW